MENDKETSVDDLPSNEITLTSDWKSYSLKWLAFGFFGGALQPVVNNLDEFWTVKLWQCISGIPFGILSAVTFIFLQNTFNKNREKNKTWIFIFCTWMSMKFVVAFLLN
jgi:hypothetical protein